ncbi:hypothetical protein B0H16DRAFT_1896199 [Mycena metata]|uniref:phytol kinase n=1 Tax=Mycena metata TaxID=1033252 RepID=A0AAD7MLM8_9AGAR|nr:hypothetical protein B0H16DRAFT_1896199 [Mycena metata]
MHPSLRLDNLSSLPLSARRTAISAAKGSIIHFQALLRYLATTQTLPWNYCLPIFYVYLDPAGIPSGEERDDKRVTLALAALNALRGLNQLYAPAGPDLWLRLWKWSAFLHAQSENLRHLPGEKNISLHVLYCIHLLRDDPTTATLIGRTVGVRTLVMDGWAALCNSEQGQDHPMFTYLATFLRALMGADQPANRAEILEATDGPTGLATLIVRSMQLFLPARRAALPEKVISFHQGIARFLFEFLNADSSPAICPALLSLGLVKPLTSTICCVADSTDPVVPKLLLGFFAILETLVAQPAPHRAIRDAITAGLLYGLVRALTLCPDAAGPGHPNSLWDMVTITLPAATVYRNVLVELEAHMSTVEQISNDPGFHSSSVYADWEDFVILAEERIEFMRDGRSRENISLNACDNLECGKIQERANFRRCSRCQQVFYCSPDCQKMDWKSGGHRTACLHLRRLRIKNSDLGARNLKFLRTLMQEESKSLTGPGELGDRLLYMRESGCDTICLFDFQEGPADSVFCPLADIREEDEDGDVLWDEHIARADRSGGRMDLHVMRVWDGNRARHLMFPQRSATSAVRDGLARICETITIQSEEDNALEELTEEVKDLIYIHQ